MTEPTSAQPKHTHYVSLDNGCIHPAMTSPAGYEDEHPTEWRPATAAEVTRYKAGADRTEAYASLSEPLTPAQNEQLTPTTITLADEDDNVGVQIQPPAPAPAPPAAPPPPPAPLSTSKD